LAKLAQPRAGERSADRRLRVGYVSPGFGAGATGLFLLPLLEAHDHQRHEIVCYSSVRTPDAITERCRAQADVWRSVTNVSDERLADIIRQDRIDILVDLTMHSADNRLLVFARKPAPVQVTYLAYAGTTGLDSMDYRLTDPYLDPLAAMKASDQPIYSEESIRLPETYWCYRPLIETPAVNALPALLTGHITFGCLNTFAKVTAPTLAAWTGLLRAMPEARLLLHIRPGKGRDRVRDLFAQGGISPERVTFAGWLPMAGYFQLYQHIDVALDPFPYGGGATTCDALWMGVPVVSLAGQTAVGRGGLSILSNLGLADLVARDVEQYVRIACELAGDLPRLSGLRATLRERMQNSPLMDAPRFARHVEAAYREMWRRWCAG
jgi:predicted O-linked N-acetylglucosamine transferase (SPINDLY family)